MGGHDEGRDQGRETGQQKGQHDEQRGSATPRAPLSGDSGSFGAGRGDAGIDRALQEVEREDGSLLAGGRHDVRGDGDLRGDRNDAGGDQHAGGDIGDGAETDADADAKSTPARPRR